MKGLLTLLGIGAAGVALYHATKKVPATPAGSAGSPAAPGAATPATVTEDHGAYYQGYRNQMDDFWNAYMMSGQGEDDKITLMKNMNALASVINGSYKQGQITANDYGDLDSAWKFYVGNV